MALTFPYRDINVRVHCSSYTFFSPSNNHAPSLTIDRPSGTIRLHDDAPPPAKRIFNVAGILGIIQLRLDKYIIVVTKTAFVDKILGHTVLKVLETEFLPLHESLSSDSDESSCVQILKNLIHSSPLYFSCTFDLTNSMQRQASSQPDIPLWLRADDTFFWNRFIQTDLINFRNSEISHSRFTPTSSKVSVVDPYILPVIFGVFETRPVSLKNRSFTLYLISRRSRDRVGTRYFSRGLDNFGNVSNFNETEQIIIVNGNSNNDGNIAPNQNSFQAIHVLSFVQVRGSIPLYWSEVNNLHYTPKLVVRNVETAVNPAQCHFNRLINKYGDVYVINLINQTGRERAVKDSFERLITILGSSSETSNLTKFPVEKLHYTYFDFHSETRGFQWDRTSLLLAKVERSLINHGYFYGLLNSTDSNARFEVKRRQTGIFRTNCMDCLDRTNVVQSMFSRAILDQMLVDVGVLHVSESVTWYESFAFILRNLWADNADLISLAYSGTGALKTDYTRTGKRTKIGALHDFRNSVLRYIKNNFLDGTRQDAFDLFHGTYKPYVEMSYKSPVFIDRRPLIIQALPFIFIACAFIILMSFVSQRSHDGKNRSSHVIKLLFTGVGCAAFHLIWTHGVLFVNWPKLNKLAWALDDYREAMKSACENVLLGMFLAKRECKLNSTRYGSLEEGKKRVE